VAQAGQRPSFYHFHLRNDGATLEAISDSYGNRLRVTRDVLGQIKRLDNGAGRGLLFRYNGSRIVAVDYQQFNAQNTLERCWTTVQTLVTYHYDAQHRLVEATNASGETERYRYDEQHVIVERQLAGGASFFWEW
jgi:YD repeat-containing protein